jgi:hypothetical protein
MLTCQITSTTHTTGGNLLAVWTFWQSSSTYTASVGDSDSRNSFVSAIGPTVQSNSTPPITAQLFYAKNIHGTAIGTDDVVTVTYTGPTSGSISLAGVVMVEYSGLDINYPLDSVSAGYSYTAGAGTALDSGFAAPANTNLLIVGAGFDDTFGIATAGTNFMSRANNNTGVSGVCGMVEDYIFTPGLTPPPFTLQHANESCANSGNWAMQMAVFRDASWAVTGGWNPARPAQIQFADQFPGTDPCAQTKAAIEAPVSGNSSPVVDSRGFITGSGIICSAAPMAPTDMAEWFPSPGVWQFAQPLIVGGRMDIWGPLLGYDENDGTVFQAQTSVWPTTGGQGGEVPTGTNCSATYNSGCTYFRGALATCNGLSCAGTSTYYALRDNFQGVAPGTGTGWQYYWTLAGYFPNPVVEVYPKAAVASSLADVESNSLHNLAISAQYQNVSGTQTITDGAVLYLNTNGEEQVIADRIKYRNPTVAGIWFDDGLTTNSGPFTGGTIGYDTGPSGSNQKACKVNVGSGGIGSGTAYSTQSAAISSITVSSPSGGIFLADVKLSGSGLFSGQLWVGEVVDIVNSNSTFSPYAAGVVDESLNTHGYWMVWGVTSATEFTILVPSTASSCTGICGTANFFPVALNVTANSTLGANPNPTGNRGFYNFTLNGTSCTSVSSPTYSNYPPLGAQWTAGSMPFHDSHIEGFRVGLCSGCFGPATQSHFSNLNIQENVRTSVLISKQYGNVTAQDWRDIQCGNNGGKFPVNCIVDLQNNNTLTNTVQNGYIFHYWIDENGTAHYEGGNCSEMTNGWCFGSGGWAFYSNGSPKVLQKSETGLDNNVLTFTPPPSPGTYRLNFVASVSAATAPFGWTATWEDSNGNAQSPTNLSLFQSGTAAPALTFATPGDYYGHAVIDIDNSQTPIVLKFTFTGTSILTKVSATVDKLQ